MKKRTNGARSWLVCALLLLCVGAPLRAQTVVKDNYLNRQLQREVWWSTWKGHRPGWFYWLVELFQDDAYRDEDRRNMLQLLPLMLYTNHSKKQSEKEKEHVDQVAQQKLFVLADITVDYAFAMAKGEINQLRNRLTTALDKAETVGVYAAMRQEIVAEQGRIEGRLAALRASDLTNADRQKGYEDVVASFRKLIVTTDNITRVFAALRRP